MSVIVLSIILGLGLGVFGTLGVGIWSYPLIGTIAFVAALIGYLRVSRRLDLNTAVFYLTLFASCFLVAAQLLGFETVLATDEFGLSRGLLEVIVLGLAGYLVPLFGLMVGGLTAIFVLKPDLPQADDEDDSSDN